MHQPFEVSYNFYRCVIDAHGTQGDWWNITQKSKTKQTRTNQFEHFSIEPMY
jgi:hypothetical protein